MIEVPLIDISAVRTGGKEGKMQVAAVIAQACRETGFFTLKGHGIDKQMIHDAYQHLNLFFARPLEEKNHCRSDEQLCPHQYNGYRALREENANALMGNPGMPGDYLEKFSMGVWVLDDSKALPFTDDSSGKMLRQSMKLYFAACQELSCLLAGLFAIAADLPENFFVDKIDNSYDFLRFHGYPAHAGDISETEGLAAHTDGSLLTLLTNTCGGLEVKTREGNWVVAKTAALDHFIVNIGNLMMRWTNDEWISTMHRAVLVNEKRRSMAFFKVVNEDVVIETLPKFCQRKASKYEPVLYTEYMHETTKILYGEDDSKS